MPANDASPLADTEVHYLRSSSVGDEFKIFVGHCGDTAAEPVPVVYVSDANGMFGSAVETVRFMQLSAFVPPMLVVGIGYRRAGIADTLAVRHRDFTPTFDPWYARTFPAFATLGGADAFRAFIRDELKPWVHANYPADAADATYFGHSLGGLFGTYTLLTEPDTFQRYAISSPSLWWQNDMMFEYEAKQAQTRTDLGAQVFFSVGEYEDHDGRQREASRLSEAERAVAGLRNIDMTADTLRMADQLRSRNFPSLDIAATVMPGEFHITVPQINFSRSLRHLFDAPL